MQNQNHTLIQSQEQIEDYFYYLAKAQCSYTTMHEIKGLLLDYATLNAVISKATIREELSKRPKGEVIFDLE